MSMKPTKILYIALLLGLMSCGGSGGGSTPITEEPDPPGQTVTLSGVAMKGPFTTLEITAFPVSDTTAALSAGIPATTSGSSFSVEVPVNTPILLQATGTFIDEISGRSIDLAEPLTSLVKVSDTDVTTSVNVLTDFSAKKTLAGFTDGLTITAEIKKSDRFVLDAFGIDANADPASLRVENIDANSAIDDPNLQLLLLSSLLLRDQKGSAPLELFSSVADLFAGSDTLANVRTSLGFFNGSNAQALYDEILASGVIQNLPPLTLPDVPGWTCAADSGCGWVLVPAKTLALSSNVVHEADAEVELVVRLSEVSANETRFTIITADDSAIAQDDYIGINRDFTIPAGDLSMHIIIPVVVDNEDELQERFTVSITPITAGYTIFNDAASVDVLINNGSPVIDDTVINDIVINTFCIRGLDRPGVNTADDCSLALPATVAVLADKTALAIELDLQADCTDPLLCNAQTQDRLVEFYLQAVDSAGMLQMENKLGEYRYLQPDIQLSSETAISNLFYLAIDDVASATLMLQAQAEGWQLRLDARVKREGATMAIAVTDLIPLPTQLLAGSRSVGISGAVSIAYGASYGCQPGHYALSADFEISPGRSANGTICSDLSIDAGELSATLTDNTLPDKELDIRSAKFALPPGHVTVVSLAEGLPVQAGLAEAAFLPPTLADGSPSALRSWLHAEGLPFSYRVSSILLTSAGVKITYDKIQYVMAINYADSDPRNVGGSATAADKGLNGLKSNDIPYSAVTDQAGSLILEETGIRANVQVAAGSGSSAYPKAGLAWGVFSQSVENGLIASKSLIQSGISIKQSTACKEAGCTSERPIKYLAISDGSNPDALTTLDTRGAIVGAVATLGGIIDDTVTVSDIEPSWGAQSDTVYAYQRPMDLPVGSLMGVYIPGYRFAMAEKQLVSDILLSHAKVDVTSQEHQVFAAGSDEFIKGNYNPSGFSVGPEIYSDASGQPIVVPGRDLSGKPLRIDNQSDVISLNTSVAAKYVIRNSGITGVFNIEAAALISPVSIYGYDMELDRFAIRQVDNRIDSYNWIDGHLAVAGDAGIDVYFENLQIDCGAHLGQGNIVFEYCDGIDDNANGVIDENCDQRLSSWSADTELFAMDFVDADGSVSQACAVPGAQLLSLQHEVDLKALDKPVGLMARWSSAGEMVGQHISLQDSYRFDAKEGRRDTGFSILTSTGKFVVFDLAAGSRYGGLNLDSAKVAVPFWLALDSDIRLANTVQLGEPMAEDSVLAKAKTFATSTPATLEKVNGILQQNFIDDEGTHLNAEYRWGNTGLGFSLPVSFTLSSLNDDKLARFIGRRQEIDLFVLSAGAGIDMIEPIRTKLSFGASADIQKLKSIRFQVDLDDPQNLSTVDDLLQSVGISNKPVLEPAFNDLQKQVNIVNKFANQGVETLIEQGIDSSVDQLAQAAASLSPTGKDPFVSLSESLAFINNLPQQINLLLNDEIDKPINKLLQIVENETTTQLNNIVVPVSGIMLGDVVPAGTDKLIADTRQAVQKVSDQANRLSSQMGMKVLQVQLFIDQINQPVADLNDAVSRVSYLLGQATTVIADECLAGAISNPERSGYLDRFNVNMASISKILGLLEAGDILVPLIQLIADDPGLASQLNSASQAIKRRAEVLAGEVARVESAIRSQVCNDDISTLLTDANVLLAELRSSAEAIESGLLGVDGLGGKLQSLNILQQTLVDFLVAPLQDIDNKLNSLEWALENGKPGALALSQAGLPASPAEVAVFTGDIRNRAQIAIQGVTSEVVASLTALLANELPGAYYTPSQIRQLLVKKIMGSAPINELRKELNQYLSEINKQLNDVVLEATDQINTVIKSALAKIENEVNDVLAEATAPIKNIPLQSASLDGFGVIAGNELERFHLGAEWTMAPNQEGKPGDTFAAALDVSSQNQTNDAAGCSIDAGKSLIDAQISAFNLGSVIAGSDVTLRELGLGFTLETGGGTVIPRGVMGRLDIIGDIGFSEFVVIDPGFMAGIGSRETYIGARANAIFSEISAEIAFLAGKTCDNTLLNELDPDIAQFIDVPASGFLGAYARGGLSVPIWTSGCALTVGVSADFGGWALAGPPILVGGLVGGGAYGEALCIASIKGKVTTILQSRGGEVSFIGNGFGVAGAGFCEQETWTSVRRSRDDSWCATGDAQFGAKYDNGWSIYQLETSAFH